MALAVNLDLTDIKHSIFGPLIALPGRRHFKVFRRHLEPLINKRLSAMTVDNVATAEANKELVSRAFSYLTLIEC